MNPAWNSYTLNPAMDLKHFLIISLSFLGVSAISYGTWVNFQSARQAQTTSAQEIVEPSPSPTEESTPQASAQETTAPTASPTQEPTSSPQVTQSPTPVPTEQPTVQPTASPSPTPAPTNIPKKKGDINSDNKVNLFDLSILLSKWNTNDGNADLNGNGKVEINDFSILMSRWEKTP